MKSEQQLEKEVLEAAEQYYIAKCDKRYSANLDRAGSAPESFRRAAEHLFLSVERLRSFRIQAKAVAGSKGVQPHRAVA